MILSFFTALSSLVRCLAVNIYNFLHWSLKDFARGILGMDAQVAYGFHHLRDEKPWLARGRTANQVSLLALVSFSVL